HRELPPPGCHPSHYQLLACHTPWPLNLQYPKAHKRKDTRTSSPLIARLLTGAAEASDQSTQCLHDWRASLLLTVRLLRATPVYLVPLHIGLIAHLEVIEQLPAISRAGLFVA